MYLKNALDLDNRLINRRIITRTDIPHSVNAPGLGPVPTSSTSSAPNPQGTHQSRISSVVEQWAR